MSSSCRSTDFDWLAPLATPLDERVTSFQIFLSPFFFFVVGTEETTGSGEVSPRGHDCVALRVGVFEETSRAEGWAAKYDCSCCNATLEDRRR